jgi:hypothetical protein
MFSDESHFELTFGNRSILCRRPSCSDRLDPRFTRKIVKHPPKLMAWGSFSWKERGALEWLEKGEIMNGMRYCRILDEKLELFIRQHGTTHFLQEGVPCHKSMLISSWFQEMPHIKLIDWPGNSPDLNPIENACIWMKMQLRESKATNLKELKEDVSKQWVLKMDDCQYLRNLVESMPRRLEDIIRREGNPTKY